MAYERKFKTAAELSAFRSELAKNRKIRKGGRPKGWTKDPALKATPSRTITVRQPDYEVFVKCAFAANVPQVEFLHMLAESLKEKNPQLFAQPQKPVNV
ncbi:MAG: hypothetical protein J6V72_19860 [Kiritimatiellae bacterium]|nr:hypothetical protein [Kiritimatiellia bacterium]